MTKPVVIDVLAAVLARYAEVAAARPPADAAGDRPAAAPVLDRARLAALRETAGQDGEAFVETLITLFLDEAQALLASLRQAAAGGDLDRAMRDAHGLKGAAANIGALELAGLAAELEARAAPQEAAQLAAAVAGLAAAFERTRGALQPARAHSSDGSQFAR